MPHRDDDRDNREKTPPPDNDEAGGGATNQHQPDHTSANGDDTTTATEGFDLDAWLAGDPQPAPQPPANGFDWNEWLANDTPTAPRPASPPPNLDDAYTQRVWRYIEGIAGRQALLTKGSRNETQNAGGYKAFQYALGAGIPAEAVEDIIYRAQVLNGQVADDGEQQIRRTLRSARGGAERAGPDYLKPPNAAGPATGPNVTEALMTDFTTNGDGGDGGDRTYRFTTGGAFILNQPDSVPALWGRGNDVLWAEGESLMIAGPMGLGKTSIAGMLLRAQLGIPPTDVLDLPVAPRPGRILYLAMDRPKQIGRALYRQFTEEHRHTLDTRLLIWEGPPPADVAKNPAIITHLAEQADAHTVYLDSVKDAAVGLSDDAVGAGYNRARQLLLQTDRELIELHHTVKRGPNGGPPTTAADVYGSAWLTNGTGSIILLTGDPGDPIVGMRHIRQPVNEVGPYQLEHDQHRGHLNIWHKTDLVALVRAAGADGLTAKDAAAALFNDTGADKFKPTPAQTQKAHRRLDALAGDGGPLLAVEGTRGRGHSTAWFAR
jgi:hypothetical protein